VVEPNHHLAAALKSQLLPSLTRAMSRIMMVPGRYFCMEAEIPTNSFSGGLHMTVFLAFAFDLDQCLGVFGHGRFGGLKQPWPV
jgi:hypothetical protein